ncbi:DinB family protein [Blastococcus sp. CT_GayMR19]|uniref:DinB family protein n=1 Tax=Blastococcus sp. CT_GayMR19 TaxID=2559608 RepID=UPI001074486C|nr:DinB family protein [Blastococcus sp. CT_GayMR19]TFV77614.1 DinB family protein [Blastococcus sp. CT_GayMR19]
MSEPGAKADLRRYLQQGRDALLWKLEGLSEYDVRRPLTPTGTNLLGLVKHLAYVEMGYFGETFGRPVDGPQPWLVEDVEDNADLWATAGESREQIVALYRRAWAHADATIEALPLDAVGRVSWWPPDRRELTLHRALVHVTAETHRHAGHADIVRELIDGAVGMRKDNDNLPPGDEAWWAGHRERVERAARQAAGN